MPRKPPVPFPAPPTPIHPFDSTHNTDTGGLIPGEHLRTGTPADRFLTAYYAVAPSILTGLVDLWLHRTTPPLPISEYSFVDIGAGKGRAVLLAATYPFREVVGIEINPRMAAIARENLRRAGTQADSFLAPARILEADALTAPLPDGPLVLFLFHPFEAPALRRLLRRINKHVTAQRRAGIAASIGQIDLLYVNAEHADTVSRDPHFHELWQGRLPMSAGDHIADLEEIATQLDYGSTGDELCAIFRYVGRQQP